MFAIVFLVALFVGVSNGAPSPRGRIVGGTSVSVRTYPSTVQIEERFPPASVWGQICGGSILTNNVVLSAAHCFDSPAYNFRIRAGATYRGRDGVIVYISSVFIHPAYGDHSVAADADICIVRLWNNLVYGETINSIAILPQNFIIPGNSPGIYAGWGMQGSTIGPPELLHHVNVNIVSHEDCERRYGGPIHRDVVCAGYDGRGSCFGDSGGPLFYGGVLAGVVAWGPEICAHPYRPGASIRTAAYSDWIVANA